MPIVYWDQMPVHQMSIDQMSVGQMFLFQVYFHIHVCWPKICLVTNCQVSKCQLAKCTLTKCLLTKCLLTKRLSVKCLMDKCLSAKCIWTKWQLSICLTNRCLFFICLFTNACRPMSVGQLPFDQETLAPLAEAEVWASQISLTDLRKLLRTFLRNGLVPVKLFLSSETAFSNLSYLLGKFFLRHFENARILWNQHHRMHSLGSINWLHLCQKLCRG